MQRWQQMHPQAQCQNDRLSGNGGHRALTYSFRAENVDVLIEMLQQTDQISDLVMVL